MQFIDRFAQDFRNLQGWKLYAMAAAMGAGLTLAFPPFWLLPLAALAFSCLLWMLQGKHSHRQRFAIGWWFGFGHHTTGLYWICIALGIDGGAFWWLMPFALCLLPAYLALYTGLVGWLLGRKPLLPTQQWVIFGLLWLVMEYIRAHFIYGFPWNLTGYIWTLSDVTLQPAALMGAYGMSLWAVLFCAAFSLLAKPVHSHLPDNRWHGLLACAVVTLGLLGWGQLRLQGAEQRVMPASGTMVRVVQANIEQSLKWDERFEVQALYRHIALSHVPADASQPDYIVWPETAMPFSLDYNMRWREVLASALAPEVTLLTGNVRYLKQGQSWQVWNNLRAMDSGGGLTASYDKHILVPFGEFVPLRAALSFLPLDKVTHGSTDFTPGPGAELLGDDGVSLDIQPLICYEAIFPEFRTDDTVNRPQWLLNITNDAWFGNSTGPYQHLHMTRMRAVERGVPLVRAANTGVSAVFDSFGRMVDYLPLNVQGAMDVRLPARLNAPTWYSRYGELPLLVICYILFTYSFLRQRKKT